MLVKGMLRPVNFTPFISPGWYEVVPSRWEDDEFQDGLHGSSVRKEDWRTVKEITDGPKSDKGSNWENGG